MRPALTCLLPLALPAAPVASAADIGYDFVEAGVTAVDGVSTGPTAKLSSGFGATGLYGSVGFTRQSLHDGGHVDAASAGLGYAHALADGLDLNIEAGAQRTKADGAHADAYRGSLGLTRAPSDAWVLSAKANRYFGGDLAAASTTASLGVEHYFTPAWSVAAEVELAEGPDAALLALHWSF